MNKKTLPEVLILRKKYIQKFPNNYEVGLYYSEELKQYISIPLDNSQKIITNESIMEQLKQISDENIVEEIQFEDASILSINKECSDIILEYITDKEIDISSSDKIFLEHLENAITPKEEQVQG